MSISELLVCLFFFFWVVCLLFLLGLFINIQVSNLGFCFQRLFLDGRDISHMVSVIFALLSTLSLSAFLAPFSILFAFDFSCIASSCSQVFLRICNNRHTHAFDEFALVFAFTSRSNFLIYYTVITLKRSVYNRCRSHSSPSLVLLFPPCSRLVVVYSYIIISILSNIT